MDFLKLLQNMNPWVLTLVAIWSVAWKGWALWRAARLRHVVCYIVLLVLNLLGIPEIIYIYVTRKQYGDLYDRIR